MLRASEVKMQLETFLRVFHETSHVVKYKLKFSIPLNIIFHGSSQDGRSGGTLF